MLTIQQKAQCVLWYHKLKSPTAIQRKLRNEFGQDSPHTNSIKRWFKNFMETGSILNRKRSGRPSIDKETVDAMRVAFHRSPRKSIRVASNELAIPRSTVEKFYINDFGSMLTSYKLFKLLSRMINLAEQLLLKKFFSALMMTMTTLAVCFFPTFHVSGKVNKHNIRIWGSENPCEVMVPKNTLCFLLNGQHVSYFVANLRLY